jgi:hypothetical protein
MSVLAEISLVKENKKCGFNDVTDTGMRPCKEVPLRNVPNGNRPTRYRLYA